MAHDAIAQTCFYVEEYKTPMPTGLASGDLYGYSVAVSGDWLFAGAPFDDQIGTNAGAVYVFQKVAGNYEFRQQLVATGSVGEARFGWSLAADGDVLLVGAENDREITQTNPNAWGAAYVFRLERDEWVQEQKLFGFGIGNARQLGWAVAIDGDVAVVGCFATTSAGVNGEGAAFVYRHDGDAWIEDQRLTSDQPSGFDRFGTALAFVNGQVLIGAFSDNTPVTDVGAVYVFVHDGVSWVLLQELRAFDGTTTDQFGYSLAVDGDLVIVGAPFDDPVATNSGSAYLFHFNGSVWQPGQKLTLASPAAEDRFGTAVGVLGDHVIVGVPNREIVRLNNLGQPTVRTDAGAAIVFTPVGGNWMQERSLELTPLANVVDRGPIDCWDFGPQPLDWPPSISGGKLGSAIAASSDGIVVASTLARPNCWDYTGFDNAGSVNVYRTEAPRFQDCNANTAPDICDFTGDANGNYVPDECDIFDGTSQDCNANNMPDEWDSDFRYLIGNQFSYLFWYGGPSSREYIWLNQFRVKPGGQVITHIAIQTTPFLPHGAPVTVLLYVDPNNDGNPTDAALVAQADTYAVSHDYTNPNVDTTRMVIVPITATYVGEPGDVFFAGAIIRGPDTTGSPNWGVAAADSVVGVPPIRRSWFTGSPPGQGNIVDLSKNVTPVTLWNEGPWNIRAVASDCNLNGIWDQCDIDTGFSLDLNKNGIPDECDVPDCLFADIAPIGGDGQVGVPDLLHVINHWGVCNPCFAICEGDLDDDCAVGVRDLLKVINNWGPCP